ncbi:MAG: 4-(cytidine 5'-diphospho)-2-C-methyl-D-erythritol kinase [Chlorobi bacterium]|nr:4-(cytidine 5'-diphospho)-2-C-methyl-D-erythritol kinase [Chlorobiota bacterium]
MIAFAPAKINIGLYIVDKRPDEYHDIVTCMVPVQWFDVVEIVKADRQKSKFCVYGDFKHEVPLENNTISQTLEILKEKFEIDDVEIHLLKQIPSGSGLGSASSDAAATINLVDKLFNLGQSVSEKQLLASRIGSDVPFFIEGNPAIASGRGEELEPVELPWLKDYFAIIVVPEERLNTAEMYSRINRFLSPPENFKVLLRQGPRHWKSRIINQFEPIAESIYPHFAQIKKILYNAGAEYVSLSGSGSAYYGLFHKSENSKINYILNLVSKFIKVRIIKGISFNLY